MKKNLWFWSWLFIFGGRTCKEKVLGYYRSQISELFVTNNGNTPDQQHWLAKLLGFDFEIRYRAGKSNVAAHAMSRKDEEGKLLSISMPMWIEWEELGAAIRAYLYLHNIILKLQAGNTEILHFSLINSLLFYDDRPVTPKVSPWVTKLLEEIHVSPMGRHSGAFRTLKKMARTFIWQGMRGDVYRFVATCVMSQHQKYSATSPMGLLQALLLPGAIWDDVARHYYRVAKVQGFDITMVVVDGLSKAAHSVLRGHPITVKAFARQIIRLHGIPRLRIRD